MPDYQLGKIYLITSETNKLLYVGSTAQKYISNRITGHIKEYKKGSNCCSYKLLECDDYEYKLLKDFPCSNVQQLKREEGFWILHYKNQPDYECVNKLIAGRTNKEWYEANRDKIAEQKKEYDKKYREDIKDKIREQRKQYRENNKDKIKERQKEWYDANRDKKLARDREYYENNKDKKKEYQKEYRENNKDKIREKRKERREKNK